MESNSHLDSKTESKQDSKSADAKGVDSAFQAIWTEKYRPKRLKDIVGQRQIIEKLSAFVQKKSLPHCLFAGSAGVGKTTAALCLANEFFENQWHSNFLELNSSDERGIDTIRVKVKDFARTMPISGLFKIVYLDEADSLTKDAQHALRRTMESYSHIARFILAANYSGKIIPPIQSRCAVFRFSALKKDDVIEAIRDVSQKENLKIDDKALEAIFTMSEGDMRKSINILQMSAASYGDKLIDEKMIYETINAADPGAIKQMLEKAVSGDFKAARSTLMDLLFQKGLAGEDIIREIHRQIFSLQIDDRKKLELIEKTGEYEFRITEGSNPLIQIEALLAQATLIGKK